MSKATKLERVASSIPEALGLLLAVREAIAAGKPYNVVGAILDELGESLTMLEDQAGVRTPARLFE